MIEMMKVYGRSHYQGELSTEPKHLAELLLLNHQFSYFRF